MSISFKTDIARVNGSPKYTITIETNIKRYFDKLQTLARECVDDSVGNSQSAYVKPQIISIGTTDGSYKVDYTCSGCECSIIPSTKGYYIHCPRCGKKIDYSDHLFFKDGINPIR